MNDTPSLPNGSGMPEQASLMQANVDQNVRLLIGDLSLQVVFAKGRIAELEAALAERDGQLAALASVGRSKPGKGADA